MERERGQVESGVRPALVEVRPLPSRLRPPRPHVELVVREALVERLRRTSAPLVCVSAPAGYGKTTLLSQWVERDGRPFAWLQLAGLHNDPVAFLAHVATSLATVAPVDLGLLDAQQGPETPLDQVILTELSRALETAAPFVLVLDDAHLVENTACWAGVELLRRDLPDGAVLAIASRAESRLPLARLRAGGEVLELRLEDLQLSAAEAQALLAAQGCELQPVELRELLDATEGWAAGVYLAVLAADGCPTRRLLSGLHGDRREIAGYLTAEVLDRQTAALQEFLVSTSVLDQLCSPLCREVTARTDAGELLGRLTRENLFVTALDDRGEWYRYHHLFRDLLLAELRRRAPDTERKLHRRAYAWYADGRDGERAVRHALAAGEAAGCTLLAARTIDQILCSGQTERARRLLLEFSDEQIKADPSLALIATTLSPTGATGRLERLAVFGESMEFGDASTPIGAASLRTWQAFARASRARAGATAMLADAEFAYTGERAVRSAFYPSALFLFIVANYLNGKTRRVQALLVELSRQEPDDQEEADAWLSLRAFLAAERGDWEEAGRLDSLVQTEPRGRIVFLELARTLVLAHRADPGLDAWLATLEAHLREGLGLTEWRLLLAADVLGEVAIGRDDQAAARWVADAEAVLLRWPDAGVLRGRTRRLREALEERRMAEPLTPSERRVLDLLPTQLTSRQIAARLFLTRNTVKSHTAHIYLKLGVTTRTDAVETARRLGLL